MDFKKGFSHSAAPLKAPCRAGEDHLGVNVELFAKFTLPLFGKVRGAENGKACHLTAIQKLTRDKARFDGFPDAYVIGDKEAYRIKLKGHEQGNELIRARLNGNTAEATEGPCACP